MTCFWNSKCIGNSDGVAGAAMCLLWVGADQFLLTVNSRPLTRSEIVTAHLPHDVANELYFFIQSH